MACPASHSKMMPHGLTLFAQLFALFHFSHGYDLRTEYLTNPMGIDCPQPRFSWKNDHPQTTYHIHVHEKDTGTIVWDSSTVQSSTNHHILYQGAPLISDTRYLLTVTTTTTNHTTTNHTDLGTFHTGLLSGAKDPLLQAKWITGGAAARLLRTQFALAARPNAASVFVSGLGYFELYCNGKKVGNQRLDVGWSDYSKRIYYVTYDLTGHLIQGMNVLGVSLGNGRFAHEGNMTGNTNNPPQLLLQANIRSGAGNTTTIISNVKDWSTHAGPIVHDSLFNGETYDARLEPAVQGWTTATCPNCQTEWTTHPTLVDLTAVGINNAVLASQRFEPIRTIASHVPIAITNPKPGMWVADFGQNMAGIVQISIRQDQNITRGSKIILRHAEILQHPPYGTLDGTLYYKNLRSAQATDVYISNGNGKEVVYSPTFTQHGFRYCEITGLNKPPTLNDVLAFEMHSDLEHNGVFTTSSPLMNQIQSNTVWSQKSNLMSIPTDCDQRDERKGWLGDIGLSAEECTYNFGTGAFYTAYLNQVQDAQNTSTGSVPDYVPDLGHSKAAPPNWETAYPVLIWTMYRYLGDVGIVHKHWSSLTNYLHHWQVQYEVLGIGQFTSGFGDWVSPQPRANGSFVGAFSYVHDLKMLEELALHAMKDMDMYHKISTQRRLVSLAFHNYWYDSNKGIYGQGLQTEHAMVLWSGLQAHGGIIPTLEIQASVLNHTLHDIMVTQSIHSTSGILGTKYLYEALPLLGRSDILTMMVQQTTFPSYGYMIHNQYEPATTLWELWDTPEEAANPADSRNHIMFGSISSYYYRHVCGIDVPFGSFGYNNITIRPMSVGVQGVDDLSFAACSVMTPHGVLNVSWTGPVLPSSSGASAVGTQCSIANEKERTYFMCPLKYTAITGVTIATYGGTPEGSCGRRNLKPNKTCSVDVSSQFNEACVGRQTCTFVCNGGNCSVAGSAASFVPHGSGIPLPNGDPCIDVDKMLAVDITCGPTPPLEPTSSPPTTQVTLRVVLPIDATAAVRVPLVLAVGHTVANVIIRSGKDVVWNKGVFRKGEGIVDGFVDGSDGVTFLLVNKQNVGTTVVEGAGNGGVFDFLLDLA